MWELSEGCEVVAESESEGRSDAGTGCTRWHSTGCRLSFTNMNSAHYHG